VGEQTAMGSFLRLASSSFSAWMRFKIMRLLGSSPQSTMVTLLRGLPLCVPTASMAFTTCMPSSTRPNTTARQRSMSDDLVLNRKIVNLGT